MSRAVKSTWYTGGLWDKDPWGLNPSPCSPAYQASRGGGASLEKLLETWAEPLILGNLAAWPPPLLSSLRLPPRPCLSLSISDLLPLAPGLAAIVSDPRAG